MRLWLDDSRGHAIDWSTQRWVQLTGRRIDLREHPWLEGPVGSPHGIGPEFFDHYATSRGLRILTETPSGLLPDVERLRGPDCEPSLLSAAVADFYTSTSDYDIDAWAQWCGAFRPFGSALAVIFSRRLQQLNVPLTGLDTSRGMSSHVTTVQGPNGERAFSAWVRRLVGTGHIIYAGAYSTCIVPDGDTSCVRVVFPLPNGNAIVLMRPVANADGSLSLISAGRGFGSPGFYFTVHRDGIVWARYVRSFRERIDVYGTAHDVRADHTLTLWGATCLRLHYRLRRRHPVSPA